MDQHQSMRLTMKVNFMEPVTVYSLVPGGWFPLAMSSAGIHILDRNILIWLRNTSERSRQQHHYEANRWWLDFLNSPTQKINPLLCAMEGRNARTPTLSEFRDEYQHSCDEIQGFFPKSIVLRHPDEDFPALYEIISNVTERHAAEADFLCSIAPLIRQRKSGRKLIEARDCILQQAGIRGFRISLVLLATLSCLYEGPTRETAVAARRIIKPKAVYTPKQAHNALADIRSLEILAAGFPLGRESIALCTRDRSLAAFWCHLGVRQTAWNGKACTIRYDISPKLFPVLSDSERRELMEALVARGLMGPA